MSGQSFLDVLSSKLAVSGVVLQGEWSQSRDGLCAYFAFSGTVSLEPGVMTLTWNAGSADGTQDLDPALLVISAVLTWANGASWSLVRWFLSLITADASISSGTPAVSIASSTTVSVPKTTVTATPTSGTTTTSISAASSHSSKNLHVLVPAIVVPIVALLLAGFALLFFLRRRRRRMAPSAAFREDHLVPETDIAQVQSTSNLLVASGSASRSLSPHFPLDGKRPMLES